MLALLLGLLVAQPASPPDSLAGAYRVYTSSGEPASLEAILAAADSAGVLFVGEEHNDPVAHQLQLALLQGAFAQAAAGSDSVARPLALSLEMFERDVQSIVDEYLADLITERHFLESSRPWNNYATDYRPLVEFAKAHGVPVLAANAPRRYVNRVTRLGPGALQALPHEAHATLPPLPYPGPSDAYRAKWDQLMQSMMEAHAGMDSSADTTSAPPDTADAAPESPMHGAGHGPLFMLEAQSLWDAAMGYTIAQHLMREPGALVVHLAGGFHVEEGTGTPEALRHYRPGTPAVVVAVRPADDVDAFDAERHAGLGDFVILTDAARPRTFESGL